MLNNISNTVKYVGADYTDKMKFENQYPAPHGMAYNSYIILADRIALLDTVDVACTDVWIENIKNILGERHPDYLIVHHMEPDHSANIGIVMDMYPEMKIIASARALSMVEQFFENSDYTDRSITVSDGDIIDLGNRQLKVFTAPFVHWPEVIVTYDASEGILFSADAFGKFGALQYEEEWLPEARRYYCNIVGKYGAQVQALFKKISNLDIKTIASLHGPVLTSNLSPYLDAYQHWSTYTPEIDGVLVAYASVYGGTAHTALSLADKLRQRGIEVMTIDLCNCEYSEAVAQAFRFSKAVFASITYDATLFTPMYDFLHRLQIKGWQNRRVGLIQNGSWSPLSGKFMIEILNNMKNIDIVEPVITIRSTLHTPDIKMLDALAEAL